MKEFTVKIQIYPYEELSAKARKKVISEKEEFLKSLEINLTKDDVIKNIKNSGCLFFSNGNSAATEEYLKSTENLKLLFIDDLFIFV